MAVEVAVFTPKPPVSLFESARRQVGTTFETLIQPTLYAEVDNLGQVQRLRNTTAVLTAMRLHNSSASARTVDFQVRSSRRVTYQAEVTAVAGENWLRLDRTTSVRGPAIFGYDWTATPAPVRLSDEPVFDGSGIFDAAWTNDSRFLAIASQGRRFAVYDAQDDFSTAYLAPETPEGTITSRCAWSADGRYLVVTYQFADNVTHPFIKVFDFDDIGSPVEITIPDVATRVTKTPRAIAWGGPAGASAPDGRYLVITDAGPERVSVWDWDSGSPVYSSGLSSGISAAAGVLGTADSIAFNRGTTSARLAVRHSSGDRLSVFDFPSATSVSKIADPVFAENVASGAGSSGLVWTYDNRYLAVLLRGQAAPFVMFDFQSGVSVRAPAPPMPTALPPLACIDVSPDGRYVVIGHGESERYTYYPTALPYLLLYDYQTGTPTRVTSSPRLEGFGPVRAAKFSPDNAFLIVAGVGFDRFYPPTGVDNVQLLDSVGVDLVVNGSFENIAGMNRETFGFTALNEIVGWFSDGAAAAPDGERLFFPARRFVDAFATRGSLYLDPVSQTVTPGPAINSPRLRQNFSGLQEGATYRLSVDVTASLESAIGLRVLWNGDPVSIDNQTTLPIVDDFALLPVVVSPGQSVNVDLDRHMLAYGDSLQLRASGAGVDVVASFVSSTQEPVDTVTEPPPPPEEETIE
jgi:WD40 repeat protein